MVNPKRGGNPDLAEYGIALAVIGAGAVLAAVTIAMWQTGSAPLQPTSAPVVENTPPPTGSAWSAVDQFKASLRKGNVAFNAPKEMDVDEVTVMQLLVSLSESVSQLKRKLTRPGEQYGGEAEVSPRMRARVTAVTTGLKVNPITDADQVVGTTGTTEWRWQVQAMTVGEQELEVTLTAVVGESSLLVDTYKKTIRVRVTRPYLMRQTLQFLRDNWVVIAGGVAAIGGVGTWLLRLWRKWKRRVD